MKILAHKLAYDGVTNLFMRYLKERLNKYLGYLGIAFILLLVISLARSVKKISEAKKRVVTAQEKVEKLKKEQEELEKKVSEVQSQEYIEKQLRDKLGLAKEGEIIIVLPDDETLKKLAPQIPEEESTLPDPNWKKWMKLFL